MAQRAERLIAGTHSVRSDQRARKRLLALEIRSGKMGFAVFEGPTKLLDWGVRKLGGKPGTFRSTVSNRTRGLLILHSPFAVVARDRHYYSAAGNRRFATITSLIRAETRRHAAKFIALTTRQVQRHFAALGCVTKHEIATGVAGQFEELSWKLPHRKKSYESEAPAMTIFDAAATGIAFFGMPAQQNGRSRGS